MQGRASARDEGYNSFRWFVLLSMYVVIGISAVGLIAPALLIGAIIGDTHRSAGNVTWLVQGWFQVGVVAGAFVGGYVIDKLGAAWAWVVGLILILVGWLVAPSIGGSYGGMAALRIVQGIGTGPIMGSAGAIAAVWFPPRQRALTTGTQGAAMATGVGLADIFMPKILKATSGYESALIHLWPVAVLGLVLTAVCLLGPKPTAPVEAAPVLSAEEQAVSRSALQRALRNPLFWVGAACVFFAGWAFQVYNGLAPTYLTAAKPLGIAMASGTTLLSISQIPSFLGAYAGGETSERFSGGRVRPALVFSFLASAVFVVLMLAGFVTGTVGVMLVVVCFVAFFSAWINPLVFAFVAKTFPPNIVGRLTGYAMSGSIAGGCAGIGVSSLLLSLTGRYTAALLFTAGLMVIGAIAAGFMVQRSHSRATGIPDQAVPGTAGRQTVAR